MTRVWLGGWRIERRFPSGKTATRGWRVYGRLVAAGIVLFLAAEAGAATWSVQRDGNGNFNTIQPALDAAADGDTILIGPGEYTEATTVRLSGWAYDIQSYAHLRCDNLTIIGAGADLTIIGPVTYQGSAGTGNPAGLSYSVNGGLLYISDLTIRHCYSVFVVGIVYMERCLLSNNNVGLAWEPTGPGGWIRDSVFETTEPIFDAMSFQIGFGGNGAGISIERCRAGNGSSIRGVQGIEITDCEFCGLGLYEGTQAVIRRSNSSGSNVAISQSQGGSVCVVSDCILEGRTAAITIAGDAPGGRFVVDNSKLVGGTLAVVHLGRLASSCELRGCDFVRGLGSVIHCEANGPSVTHDVRENYWGTINEVEIRSWIVDNADNPQIGGTVLYSPFASQSVPTETTTWGDLKALFR